MSHFSKLCQSKTHLNKKSIYIKISWILILAQPPIFNKHLTHNKKMIPKMDNCFADASNDLKGNRAIKKVKDKLFQSCAAKLTGSRLIEILLLRKISDVLDPQTICQEMLEFIFAEIYTRIYEKYRIKEDDVKEAVAWVHLNEKREVIARIEKGLEGMLRELVVRYMDGGKSQGGGVLGKEGMGLGFGQDFGRDWEESQILKEPVTNHSKNSQSIMQIDSSGSDLSPNSSPISTHQSDVLQYLKNLNHKTQMNYFFQQMKLAKPVYTKSSLKDNRWQAVCTMTTPVDDYKQAEYKASSVHLNSKTAEAEATRLVLLQIYTDNPRIWERYREIKKKLGLVT